MKEREGPREKAECMTACLCATNHKREKTGKTTKGKSRGKGGPATQSKAKKKPQDPKKKKKKKKTRDPL